MSRCTRRVIIIYYDASCPDSGTAAKAHGKRVIKSFIPIAVVPTHNGSTYLLWSWAFRFTRLVAVKMLKRKNHRAIIILWYFITWSATGHEILLGWAPVTALTSSYFSSYITHVRRTWYLIYYVPVFGFEMLALKKRVFTDYTKSSRGVRSRITIIIIIIIMCNDGQRVAQRRP